jgi:hypothetical protein
MVSFFVFSLAQAVGSTRLVWLGEWLDLCRRRSVGLAGFLLFFCRCLMPDLRLLGAFLLTRAFWSEGPSLSAPAAGRTGHAGFRSSERGLHAPEGFLPFGARDGHVSPFSGLARWGGGFRRCLFSWVVPGPARVVTRRRYWRTPPSFCRLWSVASLFVAGFLVYVCNFWTFL